MECKLCLQTTSECSEVFGKLLKWAQFILSHLQVTCSMPFMICQDCAEHLQIVQKFCEFVEQRQLANLKIAIKSENGISATDKLNDDIKLECSSDTEEYIVERLEDDDDGEVAITKKDADMDIFSNASSEQKNYEKPTFYTNNETGKTKCDVCNKTFKSAHALTCHIALKHRDKKNICKICHQEFPYKRALYIHAIKEHKKKAAALTTRKKQFACKMCPQTFAYKSSIKNHVLKAHGNSVSTSFSCESCNFRFHSKKVLDLHIQRGHNENTKEAIKDRTCILCKKLCKTATTLMYHMNENHRDEKPYSCKECSATFKHNHTLRFHTLEAHSQLDASGYSVEDRHCILCNISFRTRKALCSHTKKFHKGQRPYACDQCPQKFTMRNLLQNHKEKFCCNQLSNLILKTLNGKNNSIPIENMNEGSLECNSKNSEELLIEDELGSTANDIKANFNTERLLNPNEAEEVMKSESYEISEVESNSKAISEDSATQTSNETSSQVSSAPLKNENEIQIQAASDFSCVICGKEFFSISCIEKHVKGKHRGNRPIPCEKCGRSFSCLFKVKNHKCLAHKVYSDQQPKVEDRRDHVCGVCQKYFGTLSSLRWHTYNKHKYERPFACNFCEKNFRFHDKFKAHLAKDHPISVGMGAEDHTCTICNVCFENVHKLRQHMRYQHKNVKHLKCEYCEKKYNTYASLKRHMQTHNTPRSQKDLAEMDYENLRKCSFCNETFDSVITLGEHIYQYHCEETNTPPSND